MKDIKRIYEDYLKQFPDEKDNLKLLGEQIYEGSELFNRKNYKGHVTASATIFLKGTRKVLMIHHNFIQIWMTPGGHVDVEDKEIWQAALREAIEETQVSGLELDDWHEKNDFIPIDIDSHAIPQRPAKQEDSHFHHDFNYVFWADNPNISYNTNEVGDAQWKDFDTLKLEIGRGDFFDKVIEILGNSEEK